MVADAAQERLERPWHVRNVFAEGALLETFETQELAEAYVKGANARAEELGVQARYTVSERPT